jgi:hypothetical protein
MKTRAIKTPVQLAYCLESRHFCQRERPQVATMKAKTLKVKLSHDRLALATNEESLGAE